MTEPASRVKTWEQLSLVDPEVVVVSCRIGIVNPEGHIQFQVEAVDPRTETIIAMWSIPHSEGPRLEQDLARTFTEVARLVERFAPPF